MRRPAAVGRPAFSPTLVVLAVLAGLAGVLVSPALATAYVLTDSLASPQARNRAGNWVNSGYNAGSSAGSVLAGQLIGRIPLTACLPVLAAPTLLAVLPLLRLRSPYDGVRVRTGEGRSRRGRQQRFRAGAGNRCAPRHGKPGRDPSPGA